MAEGELVKNISGFRSVAVGVEDQLRFEGVLFGEIESREKLTINVGKVTRGDREVKWSLVSDEKTG